GCPWKRSRRAAPPRRDAARRARLRRAPRTPGTAPVHAGPARGALPPFGPGESSGSHGSHLPPGDHGRAGPGCDVRRVGHHRRPALRPGRRPRDVVTLVVEEFNGLAYTSDNGIHLSTSYVGGYTSGDVKKEVTGVLYHEATHVWQWNGQGAANGGLIEGIADYMRLKAGLAPGHWRPRGSGNRWGQLRGGARTAERCWQAGQRLQTARLSPPGAPQLPGIALGTPASFLVESGEN
uniref:Uncharacterized protein n=1 Tax=Aegilops tauschii subsp. strangulata TaxID=200361 RepID=A0A453MFC0_AEGTS